MGRTVTVYLLDGTIIEHTNVQRTALLEGLFHIYSVNTIYMYNKEQILYIVDEESSTGNIL